MMVRIDHAVTSGTFSLDGQTFDVDNNVWVIGNDEKCVVIDAPHDVEAIATVVGERECMAILCSHGHDDHVRFAPQLAERLEAPILLHEDELPVWRLTHPDLDPDDFLEDGDIYSFDDVSIEVMHTPGHAPGAVCFYVEDLGTVFTGDTLFHGGPGATGRSFSDYDTIVESIRSVLFELPDDTVVNTGHGESTTIGAEREGSASWTKPE
ncbi:MBL fold metallo-hydrolase [Micrococcales bacterium 31B]|nr:MBL fold metallo-hydrolase [Micrococcales bacterium 31B]